MLFSGANISGIDIEDIFYFFKLKLWNILYACQFEVLVYTYCLNDLNLAY